MRARCPGSLLLREVRSEVGWISKHGRRNTNVNLSGIVVVQSALSQAVLERHVFGAVRQK